MQKRLKTKIEIAEVNEIAGNNQRIRSVGSEWLLINRIPSKLSLTMGLLREDEMTSRTTMCTRAYAC